MRAKLIGYAVPVVFACLGFLIYSNVLHGPFLFDDSMYILGNYQNQTASIFSKDIRSARYVGYFSFAINYYIGGFDTFGYHLVNIIIHIINAMLVYVLVEAMGNGQWSIGNRENPPPIAYRLLPIACSLIFLVHPIQTQAVSYITQRFASLATLFYLLAIVLYIKARCYGLGHRHSQDSTIAYHPLPIALYILSILSAIFAMKTKEISFTLPFIMLLYEWTFFDSQDLQIRTRFLCLLPFFLTLPIIPAAVFWPGNMDIYKADIGIGEAVRQLQIIDIKTVPVHDYLITQFRVILTYIRLLFFPINQSFVYDYQFSKSIFEPATFASGIFILTAAIFAAYLYMRSRRAADGHGLLISFGILWFFITLSVESSVIPIKDVIFEHRLYLPSIGFILSATTALFYGFDYLEKQTQKPLYRHLLSIVIFVAMLLSFLTYKRNIAWSDNYLMFLDGVAKAPNNPSAHHNIGVLYSEQGQLDKAIIEYLTALRLAPDFEMAHNGLGFVYAMQGRFDEAEKEYLTAIGLRPYNADAHHNLGSLYFKLGRFDEAITEYLTALKFSPSSSKINHGIGVVYYSKGLMDEAVKYFQMAMDLKPDYPEVHYNIGIVYYQKGMLDEAIAHFEASVKLKPDYVEAYNNLAIAYYDEGRTDKAFEYLQAALKIKPADHESHYNAGLFYLKKGFKGKAAAEFETVLKLKPDFALAREAIESLGKKYQTFR